MTRLRGFVSRQGQFLLENSQHAILASIALAVVPYAVWLSIAIIALVTLRKGWRAGLMVFVPSALVAFAWSQAHTTSVVALLNTLINYLPCYLAACALRYSESWRVVSAVFFLQVALSLFLLQWFAPEFITAQYLYIQAAVGELQAQGVLLDFLHEHAGVGETVLANYLLGLQMVGVVLSAALSLMVARSVQSQLFYPGGFKREILAFRSDKVSLLFLLAVLFAAKQQYLLAVAVMPALLFYFLLAGLSLSVHVLTKKKPLSSFVFLTATLLLLPFVMLPLYVVFGSLDSVFNFREYLRRDAGKTM